MVSTTSTVPALPSATLPLAGTEAAYVTQGSNDCQTPISEIAKTLVGGAKTIFFNRDMTAASGNVTYSGVGFTPSLVLFMGILPSNGSAFGVDNLTIRRCYMNATAGSWQTTGASSIYLTADYVNIQEAYVASFNSDGFVLSWTKTLLPVTIASLSAICFR